MNQPLIITGVPIPMQMEGGSTAPIAVAAVPEKKPGCCTHVTAYFDSCLAEAPTGQNTHHSDMFAGGTFLTY